MGAYYPFLTAVSLILQGIQKYGPRNCPERVNVLVWAVAGCLPIILFSRNDRLYAIATGC